MPFYIKSRDKRKETRMLNKYIRYFNQNRMKILAAILIIVLSYLIIQMLNISSKEKNERELNEISSKIGNVEKEVKKSVIGEGDTSEEVAERNEKIIDTFIKYCNEKNVKQAYELLSDDCKNILFPTESDFINNYYNIVFNSYKIYELENWISKSNMVTYKVRYTNDVLASGGYISDSIIEDYYTVVEQDKNYKLNINKFINKEVIDKSREKENLSITIQSIENYIDYQIYDVSLKNENESDIQIYNVNQKSEWNVVDKNDLKYSAYIEEIQSSNYTIKKGQEEVLRVKYAKMYNPKREVETINFNNMYLINDKKLFSIEIDL